MFGSLLGERFGCLFTRGFGRVCGRAAVVAVAPVKEEWGGRTVRAVVVLDAARWLPFRMLVVVWLDPTP